MKHKGILIVVSGFSGAGKGTLMKLLMQTYDNYALSVSMTTRSPRDGEIDGVHYFFSTKEQFEEFGKVVNDLTDKDAKFIQDEYQNQAKKLE